MPKFVKQVLAERFNRVKSVPVGDISRGLCNIGMYKVIVYDSFKGEGRPH